MTADLAKSVADLLHAVRGGQGTLLMDLDGVPVEQAGSAGGAGMEAVAGEYAGLLQQAQALAVELGCGTPQRLSVRGATRCIVFAFVPGELALGVASGPGGLCGQMRHAIARVAGQLGEV